MSIKDRDTDEEGTLQSKGCHLYHRKDETGVTDLGLNVGVFMSVVNNLLSGPKFHPFHEGSEIWTTVVFRSFSPSAASELECLGLTETSNRTRVRSDRGSGVCG